MQFANTDRTADAIASRRAEILVEALPWIKSTTGKTVVIKYGGAAMTSEELRDAVVSDIVLMKLVGLNPIIVHGGGKDISRMCEALDIPVEFKNGMRVTSDTTMEVVKMVLLGKVNSELVDAINAHGHLAVGISGADAHVMKATQLDAELGRVGSITEIDTTLIEDLIAADYIPVIASVASGEDGRAYNVNADVAAGAIAAAIGAQKIIFLTDVDGLYENFEDKDTLISSMTLSEAEELVDSNRLSKGMIPKITACTEALSAGVAQAHILNGTSPHAMLLEMFTDAGIGTMITNDEDRSDPDFVEFPITNLASKIAAEEESEE
jgi:acetylglutamate kinase